MLWSTAAMRVASDPPVMEDSNPLARLPRSPPSKLEMPPDLCALTGTTVMVERYQFGARSA